MTSHFKMRDLGTILQTSKTEFLRKRVFRLDVHLHHECFRAYPAYLLNLAMHER